MGKPLDRRERAGCKFQRRRPSGGEFTEFDWNNVNITHCDLTNSDLGELNIRKVDLDGVKIDDWQQSHLLEKLGVIVIHSK